MILLHRIQSNKKVCRKNSRPSIVSNSGLINLHLKTWIVWDVDFKREKIGDVPTEMFFHFFKSFTDSSKANLNIKTEGSNEHHKIEAVFKAFAKAVKMAVNQSDSSFNLPSTKGSL
jgi:imidazoleglycerol-phosphate dehydratase/histidinol-phosphatase